MTPEMADQIIQLYRENLPKRAIARRLGIDVKTVRRVLDKSAGQSASVERSICTGADTLSKLDPYRGSIREKTQQGLSCSRILREIREQGYSGGKTILGDYIRTLRGPAHAQRKAFKRFETGPAEEAQVDWSPYRVRIAGREQVVHAFSMILCYSRYTFIQFHRDERLPSVLAAHVDAFRFFKGSTRTIVYDNMTTVTLGRQGREILWNSDFLKFAQHYLYTPRVCRPRDPNRKGKVEKGFRYLSRDFLQAREFDSWDDLNRSCMHWLTTVANRRMHSTTRQVPEEAWMAERDLLTALPDLPYPTYHQVIRVVYDDCTIAVDGTRYSVPAHALAPKSTATVRIHSHFIEILDRRGQLMASHRKPDLPGGLVITPEHYRTLGSRTGESNEQVESGFVVRFPQTQLFVDGLKKRMKGLYRLHLIEIIRLAQVYGDDATAGAMAHAGRYANFNAYAVGRILKQRFPLISPDGNQGRALTGQPDYRQINDVESGNLEDYRRYSGDEPSPWEENR